MADTQDHIRVPLPITMDPPHFFPKPVRPTRECASNRRKRIRITVTLDTFLTFSDRILTNGRQLNVEYLASLSLATSIKPDINRARSKFFRSEAPLFNTATTFPLVFK